MNGPPQPGPGHEPGPDTPWYLRRPTSDDHTSIARPRPAHHVATHVQHPTADPPAARRPPARHRPPDIPWYLQRPDRPQHRPRCGQHQKPTAKPKDTDTADPKRLLPWLLVGAGGVAVLIGTAVLLGNISKLGITGGTVLDVTKVQTGVLQTLSDPASGYGANTVTDVSCNNGHNPSADKGTTFTCDARSTAPHAMSPSSCQTTRHLRNRRPPIAIEELIAVGYTDQYSSIGSFVIVAGPRVMVNATGDTRHRTPLLEAVNWSSTSTKFSISTESRSVNRTLK